MKATTKSPNGTWFHDSVIVCTVQTLKDILGECTYGNNDGEDKVNYEWVLETEKGEVFTVYDWKEYRPLKDNDLIEWHIGGFSQKSTEEARQELQQAISKVN